MKKLNIPYLLITLFLLSSCSVDLSGITESPDANNSVATTDGGSYNPSSSGATGMCEQDDEGNCVDNVGNTEIVYLSNVTFDFGFSEIGDVECGTLAIPGGMVYQAEIDKSEDNDGNPTTSVDGDGTYQFAPGTDEDNTSQDRTSLNQGDVQLCYLRTEVGTHSGSVIVSFKEPDSADWQYVVTTKLTGETGEEPFWNINSPKDGDVFDEREGYNDGTDPIEGDIFVNADGSISSSYHSILKNGLNTPVHIQSDSLEYDVDLDNTGNFFQQIALPETPGIYTVKFSAETNRSTTITKTHKVVVADAPDIEILVKDEAGNDVDAAIPTDMQNLIVGIRVKNLPVSGANEDERNVVLSDITFNGTSLSSSTTLWYDEEVSWCRDEEAESDYTGFDTHTTYCIPLSDVVEPQSGVNTISAKATNALGEDTATFSLILDYDKPIITITSPLENQMHSPSTRQIVIEGTIENFRGFDVEDAPAVQNTDTGSYCIPSDTQECNDSTIKLWFNIGTTVDPIILYPEYDEAYQNKTSQEINAMISEANPEQCREVTDSTSHYAGDSSITEISTLSSVVSTIEATDSDGNATTTIYETNTDGTVTKTVDGATETLYSYTDTGSTTKEVTVSEDGTITTTVYDAATDTTTIVESDGVTGEITESSTQFKCNIPKASFKIKLSNEQVPFNLFTNVFEIRAESIAGHRAIKIGTFQIGATNSHSYLNGTLTAGSLGKAGENCENQACVKRSPLMLHLSEGIVDKSTSEGRKIIAVIENLLNDNLPFENLANGWPLPEDENGNVYLYQKFKEQYEEETEKEFPRHFHDLSKHYRKKFIYQGLHKMSMVEKLAAMQNYRNYRVNILENCDFGYDGMCFFENTGNPLHEDLNKAYNVAKDSCNQTITTAFVPLKDHAYFNDVFSGTDVLVTGTANWPTDIAGTDKNFNDFVSGKWVVESFNIKKNGKVDADICVLPDEDRYTSCEQDVSDSELPAFWGHFTAYNLIEDGLLQIGGVNDLTGSFIWSLGKVRLNFIDVLQISKELRKNETGRLEWGNRLDIDQNKIYSTVHSYLNIKKNRYHIDNDKTNEKVENSIILEPFGNCRAYYRQEWESRRRALGYNTGISEDQYPMGCNVNQSDNEANYPVLLERNTDQGHEIYKWLMNNGKSESYLLGMIWEGVAETFGKMVGCMDTEIVDPLLGIFNPDYRDGQFPPFTPEQDEWSTEIEWEDLNTNIDVMHSDLIVTDGGITARLMMTAGLDGVSLTAGEHLLQAFTKGHINRTHQQGTLDDYPLMPGDSSQAFFSSSINLEEIANAATYMIFKKGPFSWIDELGLEELETDGSHTATANAVVFGNFDICDSLAGGLLDTEIPAGVAFAESSWAFDSVATSLDLIMDPNHPITLAIEPYEFTTEDGSPTGILPGHSIEVKIGITNLQASVKEFFKTDSANLLYEIGDEVFRLRMDGVISLVLVYHPQDRKIHAFFPQNQNYHLSVVPGHSGPVYDDVSIVTDLHGLIGTAFAKFEKSPTFSSIDDSLATAVIKLAGANNTLTGDNNTAKISITGLNNLEADFNMDPSPNGSCEGTQKPQYAENRTATSRNRSRRNRLASFFNRNGNNNGGNRQPVDLDFDDLEEEEQQTLMDLLSDGCNDPFQLFEDENTLDVELCEIGIDDILIDPTLVFDGENGYIHLSGDLTIKLEQWMKEKLY